MITESCVATGTCPYPVRGAIGELGSDRLGSVIFLGHVQVLHRSQGCIANGSTKATKGQPGAQHRQTGRMSDMGKRFWEKYFGTQLLIIISMKGYFGICMSGLQRTLM